jgi:hypothetical protein
MGNPSKEIVGREEWMSSGRFRRKIQCFNVNRSAPIAPKGSCRHPGCACLASRSSIGSPNPLALLPHPHLEADTSGLLGFDMPTGDRVDHRDDIAEMVDERGEI